MALPVRKHVTEKGVEVITSDGEKSFEENDGGTVAKVIVGKHVDIPENVNIVCKLML